MINENTLKLIKQAQSGDEQAKELLVNNNMGLVWSIVKRFLNRGYETEDLLQIGSLGLIKAINKFDINFNTKFSTYAVHIIIGEIRRFIRDDSPIRVSRSLKEIAAKVKKIREEILKTSGHDPSISTISEIIGVSAEEVVACIEITQSIISLDDVTYKNDGSPLYVIDHICSNDNSGNWLNKLALKEAMEKLNSREKQLITLRFIKDLTQAQIAKILNISQVQVSRLEKKIIYKMRENISD